MSSKARVLGLPGHAERFDWGAPAPARPREASARTPRPALMAPATPIPADPPVAVALPTPAELAITHEQQARLAALEREAFTKGYAQGERAGLEAGGKRAEAMLRRVAQTLEDLAGLRQSLIRDTERQMVQLALTLARRVVHREVSLDPELTGALAHVALEKLATTTPATIRLHPDDYTIVTQDGPKWGSTTVTVVPDPAIPRGGCIVESDFGYVDATIDRQFEELSRVLLGEAS